MVRYVLGFCFDFGCHNVLLILKARPEWQRGLLNGLGGHVEEGEDPRRAMGREFDEETEGKLRGVEWTPFARLRRGDEFEVWCFCGEVGFYFSHLEGLVVGGEVLHVVPRRLVDRYPAVPNVSYLVPMAFNRLRGLDRAEFLEVCEAVVPEECGGGKRG